MVRHGWRSAFWWCLAGVGAKRHMPNLHSARPHLQSHSLAAHLQKVERSVSLCAGQGAVCRDQRM